jgi:hypothetical protein
MALLPKSVEASGIKDYQPIALIHTIGKLISKVLANRLALRLSGVVHQSQSAFIKGHYIQDNFKLVQASAKPLHVRRKPSLLIKLGIARALTPLSGPSF